MRFMILASATVLALSGCAQQGGAGFQSASYGYAIETETGVVSSKRPVEISTGNTGLGATVGALAGGIAGSQLGPGRSRRRGFSSSAGAVAALGALGGALVGGLLGNAIENNVSRKVGTEYVVRMDDGSLVTIVQEDGTIAPGQRVYLQTTRGGFGQLTPST